MLRNYECPECGSRVPISVEERILCAKCGADMRSVLLYSAIIWPSRRENVQKLFKFSNEELERSEMIIKDLETRDLPEIKPIILELKIPRVATSDIYELRQSISKLEKDLQKELERRLRLDKIREEIRTREKCMATLSMYMRSPEPPVEYFDTTIDYLRNRIKKEKDPILESILKKMQQQRKEYADKWKYRTPVTI